MTSDEFNAICRLHGVEPNDFALPEQYDIITDLIKKYSGITKTEIYYDAISLTTSSVTILIQFTDDRLSIIRYRQAVDEDFNKIFLKRTFNIPWGYAKIEVDLSELQEKCEEILHSQCNIILDSDIYHDCLDYQTECANNPETAVLDIELKLLLSDLNADNSLCS